MRQLNGWETLWFAVEDENQPMHFSILRLYDPSTAPGGKVTFSDIYKLIESKLDKIPVYRQKLRKLPIGLGYAFWVDDEDFDLNNHIRNIALPAPGDSKQLFKLACQIHSYTLDKSRPLWERWVIEGLDNIEGLPKGSYAILIKSHHALIDGGSEFEIENILHSDSPRPETPAPPEKWSPEKTPNLYELYAVRAGNSVMKSFMLTRDMAKLTKGALKTTFRALSNFDLKLPARAPKTRFNGPVTRNFNFGFHTVNLDEVKTIKKAVEGATVTDVAMTTISGAMRRYLDDKGELPSKSMRTMNPVSVRREEEMRDFGNLISLMLVSLRSDIADPLKRLEAVRDESVKSKKLMNTIGQREICDGINHMPELALIPPVWLGKMTKTLNPGLLCNTYVTSVPGPRKPLYMNGAQLAGIYGLAFLQDGNGLIHAVSSYIDKLTFTVTSCRSIIPDPEVYIQCIQDSFDELKTAALGQAAGVTKKSSKGTTSSQSKKSSKRTTSADELKAAASGQESGRAEKSSKGKSSSGTKKSSKDKTSA